MVEYRKTFQNDNYKDYFSVPLLVSYFDLNEFIY